MDLRRIFALLSLFNALLISLGFTPNRTDSSVIPQLNLRSTTSAEVLMKDVPTGVINVTLGTFSKKKSLDERNTSVIEGSLIKKRSEGEIKYLTDRIQSRSKFIDEPILRVSRQEKNEVSSQKSIKRGPLNVVLLLIDKPYNGGNKILSSQGAKLFSVRGSLQSCPKNTSKLHSANRHMSCNCEDLLRSSVMSLLSWAQSAKEMSTSTLYESPVLHASKVEKSSRSFLNPSLRRIDRQLNLPRLQSSRRHTSPLESSIEPSALYFRKRAVLDDNSWHISNVLTKLRDAFFRTLDYVRYSGEQKNFNDNNEKDSLFLRQMNFQQLTKRVFEDLVTISDERGYIFVIGLSEDELDVVLELVQRYVSSANSLIVVTYSCPNDNFAPVPFMASGPGSERLSNVKHLQGVPRIIRNIIGEATCRGSQNDCETIRKEKIPKFSFHGSPILMYDEIDMPGFSVVKNDEMMRIRKKKKRAHKNRDQWSEYNKLNMQGIPGYFGINIFIQDDDD